MGLRRRASTNGGTTAAEAATEITEEITDGKARGLGRLIHKPMTPARAKRLIGVGKAVAPILAPYALAAAGAARARWDAYRAARLGVEPGQLAAFSGPGGALHARLCRMAEALDELERRAEPTTAARDFVVTARPRLADLAVAVRAAEQMPSSRRRAAYRAIGGELDRLEQTLLQHLGVGAA